MEVNNGSKKEERRIALISYRQCDKDNPECAVLPGFHAVCEIFTLIVHAQLMEV